MARIGPKINLIETDSGDWRDRSACRNTDPNIFFPISETGPDADRIRVAKAICATCDVQAICLEFALINNEENGIWGGTTEKERRRIRKNWLRRERQSRSSY